MIYKLRRQSKIYSADDISAASRFAVIPAPTGMDRVNTKFTNWQKTFVIIISIMKVE
jgi:hypothetical protein